MRQGAFALFMRGGLRVEALRGYSDDQFIRSRYTLLVESQINDGDSRMCCWEFGNNQPPRFMGYTAGSEVAAQIAKALKAVVDRHDKDCV